MSVLIEEKILQIVAVSGADYEDANKFLSELGGGYSNAEKTLSYLKYGLTFDEIKDLHKKGLFKYGGHKLMDVVRR